MPKKRKRFRKKCHKCIKMGCIKWKKRPHRKKRRGRKRRGRKKLTTEHKAKISATMKQYWWHKKRGF